MSELSNEREMKMIKTDEEIQALKDNWVKDPCWDIEDTEGFEEHHDELLAWREDLETKHRLAARARAELRLEKNMGITGVHNKEVVEGLHTWSEIENELFVLDRFVIAREQVRATLLLAAQVKRVADALEEANLNVLGTDAKLIETLNKGFEIDSSSFNRLQSDGEEVK